MKRFLALLFSLCLLLTGCGGRQLEEELLVIVLAVDQTEAGETKIAVKVPGSGDGGKEAAENGGYLLLEAAGHDFADAFTLLNVTTPRKLNFSQVREIVVGERAAGSEELPRLLQQIDALPRFRCSAAVIVCRGEADDFADAQKPYVGQRLSRYAETSLSNYAGKGFIPETTLCEGVRDMGYGFSDPLFIAGAVNDFARTEAPETDNMLDETAGELPRKSANPIEVFGAAATDGTRVSGYLTGYETALVNLLKGHGEALTLGWWQGALWSVRPLGPAKLKVDLSQRPALLHVAISCQILYPPGFPPEEQPAREQLTRDITDVIRRLQALRCDGVGFGDAAARQFWTVGDWEALSWRQVYAEADVSVDVTVTCRER